MNKILQKNLIIILAIFAFLMLDSCKKYEDGPLFSFRSAKNRLAGDWEVLDIENSALQFDIFYTFDKDGRLNRTNTTIEYNNSTWSNDTITQTLDGSWNFEDGKNDIEITVDGEEPELFTILKLTKNDIWLSQNRNGNTWELKRLD